MASTGLIIRPRSSAVGRPVATGMAKGTSGKVVGTATVAIIGFGGGVMIGDNLLQPVGDGWDKRYLVGGVAIAAGLAGLVKAKGGFIGYLALGVMALGIGILVSAIADWVMEKELETAPAGAASDKPALNEDELAFIESTRAAAQQELTA